MYLGKVSSESHLNPHHPRKPKSCQKLVRTVLPCRSPRPSQNKDEGRKWAEGDTIEEDENVHFRLNCSNHLQSVVVHDVRVLKDVFRTAYWDVWCAKLKARERKIRRFDSARRRPKMFALHISNISY